MPPKGERRRGKGYDFEAFRGYRGPRFTPIPDEFLDHQLAHITSAEAKVMLFLFRKTYGYRKSGDRVSLAQLEHGTVSSDGTIIDRGTGLSRATIWRALKGLQAKGLIEVHRQTTPAGDSDVNYYRIREALAPEQVVSQGPTAPNEGSFSSETTPVSELNHPGLRTKPRGGFSSEPTRTDSTREDFTLQRREREARTQDSGTRQTTAPISGTGDHEALADRFLRAIGYVRPAPAKRQRTLRILRGLQEEGDYSLEDLEAACDIAASMGARGPELLPHVIGRARPEAPESKVGERLSREEEQERRRWEELTAAFEALADEERLDLLESARESSPILARRPLDHPLVRAAAIATLDEE